MFEFLNLSSILSIFIALAYVCIAGFGWYFPLQVWVNHKLAVRYSIPFSISIQIIIGYVFYVSSFDKWFPIIYGCIVVVANAFALSASKQVRQNVKTMLQSITWRGIGIFAVLILPLLYTRWFDAITQIAPGNNDTYNHMFFLENIDVRGFITTLYYPPGYHLVLYPLYKLIPYGDMYRFAGPAIGVITVLGLYLLFQNRFKHWSSKILLLLAFSFPLFNEFTLQSISLFSTALSFIYFGTFIALITEQDKSLTQRVQLVLYLLMTATLAVTVPYMFVQYLPAICLMYVVLFFLRKNTFFQTKIKLLRNFICISILGLLLAFGHVFLMTSILDSTQSLPEIPTVEKSAGETYVVSTNRATVPDLPDATTIIQDENSFFSQLRKSSQYQEYVQPVIATAIDVLKIKNIREPNSLLAMGAYIWIVFAIGITWFGIRKNDITFFTIGIFSILYGFAIQTGSLELTFYRGRSGWYLLLLLLLGFIYIYDALAILHKRWIITIIICTVYISGFLVPPTFYRSYYNEPFIITNKLVHQFPNQTIAIASNQHRLSLLSENVITLPLSLDEILKHIQNDQLIIIFDKEYFIPDPILSQQANAIDEDLSSFSEEQSELAKQMISTKQAIKSSKEFKKYFSKVWENENIAVYSLHKITL